MQRVGIIGGGKSGQQHIENIKKIQDFEFSGIFDFDNSKTIHLHKKYNHPTFSSIDELIDNSDIVDIASPDVPHFELASRALRKSRHVFIDRPLVGSISEAKKLVELAFEADVKVQIGHVERYNPAFVLASKYIEQPTYIESRRMLPFDSRNTNQHIVLDTMIHDIDIVLSIVDSGIKRIQARGQYLGANKLYSVNALIEFDNGCVANLTSGKLSPSLSATMQVFQKNSQISIDMLKNEVHLINDDSIYGDYSATLLNANENQKDPLFSELDSFKRSIHNNTIPFVSIMDGSNALEVAFQILEKVGDWSSIGVREKHLGYGF